MPEETQNNSQIVTQTEPTTQNQPPINSLPVSQSKSKGCFVLIIGIVGIISFFFLQLVLGHLY
ncbi:MAG: hypothetical protein A3F35_03060 [Candidatus Woykebacteria bacterium RIFCSPHIGHO2_12_FULL_45_10]|uniref:Uncharacterized protein n=1 Tax=Candidatus Woykebacteria bacterium RIFCSPHIGHO2_12_FULL_45_10 TaxID=1802603 RepID=A0A1G1WP79_9BACT|nr:MAG: hypothetical protein A3F35_03060 [Candidatus Woykebacteria bacterium RIFCSPHIGHO2_12_FULL_45_10]